MRCRAAADKNQVYVSGLHCTGPLRTAKFKVSPILGTPRAYIRRSSPDPEAKRSKRLLSTHRTKLWACVVSMGYTHCRRDARCFSSRETCKKDEDEDLDDDDDDDDE